MRDTTRTRRSVMFAAWRRISGDATAADGTTAGAGVISSSIQLASTASEIPRPSSRERMPRGWPSRFSTRVVLLPVTGSSMVICAPDSRHCTCAVVIALPASSSLAPSSTVRTRLTETRETLEELRALIKAAAPDATETISYAIPTFDLNGRHLVHFAGFIAVGESMVEPALQGPRAVLGQHAGAGFVTGAEAGLHCAGQGVLGQRSRRRHHSRPGKGDSGACRVIQVGQPNAA